MVRVVPRAEGLVMVDLRTDRSIDVRTPTRDVPDRARTKRWTASVLSLDTTRACRRKE
jgi:hypothetical protein